MVSDCFFSRSFLNRAAIAAVTIALLGLPFAARAQAGSASDGGQQYSSSSDWKSYLTSYDLDGAPSPSPSAKASPQYGQNPHYPDYTSRWSHLAFVAGAGFTAPLGNTTHGGPSHPNSIGETYGYNIRAGAGWNFTKHLGVLLEYNFNRDKIPGSTLTELSIANNLGTPIGGNVNTWSFTAQPIFYVPVTHTLGGYVTGGGGFYRKVTNFTVAVTACDIFFCSYVPQTIAHSSSNQGGLNIGLGGYWKAFGEDSNSKLFTEVRYVWVDSPVASSSDPFGSGTSSLLPVTFGIRF